MDLGLSLEFQEFCHVAERDHHLFNRLVFDDFVPVDLKMNLTATWALSNNRGDKKVCIEFEVKIMFVDAVVEARFYLVLDIGSGSGLL